MDRFQNVTVDCKEQNARKVMFWAAVVDRRVFVHWFASGSSVTGPAYLRLLRKEFWPHVLGGV